MAARKGGTGFLSGVGKFMGGGTAAAVNSGKKIVNTLGPDGLQTMANQRNWTNKAKKYIPFTKDRKLDKMLKGNVSTRGQQSVIDEIEGMAGLTGTQKTTLNQRIKKMGINEKFNRTTGQMKTKTGGDDWKTMTPNQRAAMNPDEMSFHKDMAAREARQNYTPPAPNAANDEFFRKPVPVPGDAMAGRSVGNVPKGGGYSSGAPKADPYATPSPAGEKYIPLAKDPGPNVTGRTVGSAPKGAAYSAGTTKGPQPKPQPQAQPQAKPQAPTQQQQIDAEEATKAKLQADAAAKAKAAGDGTTPTAGTPENIASDALAKQRADYVNPPGTVTPPGGWANPGDNSIGGIMKAFNSGGLARMTEEQKRKGMMVLGAGFFAKDPLFNMLGVNENRG